MAEEQNHSHAPPVHGQPTIPLPQVNANQLPGAGENTSDEDAEWEAIARESLTNEDLDAVAKHLRATGQASA